MEHLRELPHFASLNSLALSRTLSEGKKGFFGGGKFLCKALAFLERAGAREGSPTPKTASRKGGPIDIWKKERFFLGRVKGAFAWLWRLAFAKGLHYTPRKTAWLN